MVNGLVDISDSSGIMDCVNAELDILIYFLKNPDKVIRKEVLFNAVWGSDCFSEISTLTVYIRWLREKIEDDPKEPKYIHTVWRVGYMFGEAPD